MNTLTAKFVKSLPEVSGQGREKAWRKQEFVVITNDNYPKNICFALWNDKIEQLNGLVPDQVIEIDFDIQSREYNEKYYTELSAFKVKPVESKPAPVQSESINENQEALPTSTGDLPF